jgi:hypothetical protein
VIPSYRHAACYRLTQVNDDVSAAWGATTGDAFSST